MPSPTRTSLLALLALLALVASAALLAALSYGCGSEAVPGAGASGGTSGTIGPGAPSGMCRFVLVSGAQRTSFEGKARAKMNGSGNLNVACDAADGGPAALRLGFGNATFDGPRTYNADDFTSDGSFDYATGAGVSYSSHVKGAKCALVLSEASPLDARGDSVVRGGRVAATFTCSAVVASPKTAMPPSFVVEEGVMAATVE